MLKWTVGEETIVIDLDLWRKVQSREDTGMLPAI